jgi:antitoxin CptB
MELAPHRGKLRWRMMRRGLLELDLVFERFLSKHFDALDDAQLAALDRLLDWEDTDLWEVVSGRRECDDMQFKELVDLLRAG